MPKNNSKQRKEWRRTGARLRKNLHTIAMTHYDRQSKLMDVEALRASPEYREAVAASASHQRAGR